MRVLLLIGLLVCGLVSLVGCKIVSEEPGIEVDVRKDGDFEIEAPSDFFASAYDEFAISWVDFYR